MSVNRILILVVVGLLLLYAVSVGLGSSRAGTMSMAQLKRSWFTSFTKPARVELAKVEATAGSLDPVARTWTLPSGSGNASLRIPAGGGFGSPTRELKFTRLPAQIAAVVYQPKKNTDGTFSDAEARPTTLKPPYRNGDPPAFTVLRQGGILTLTYTTVPNGGLRLKFE